jgi:FlaA1/EpsC-like NDP-sugar epimerase
MKVKTLLVGGGGLLGSALCEKLTKQTNREVLVLGRSEVLFVCWGGRGLF